uniref:non-specific serine/threonine protein kinase n=1 Tax=Callorhinchus milii TaxID=7868 RepID=V9KVI2_CALMI
MAAACAPPKLEGFILTERLGSGTYATVYKAYRKANNREVVAIKCISKKSLNKASVENLLTEIEILKTVQHPHIVQLKDFQWDSNNIYLIMEFAAAGDLSRFIRSRRILPERVARRFLQQLASALQYLHVRNISHLDLKPQNILLSSVNTPHLKLADFGFALYMSPWDEKRVLRGSPLYMAPEMVCQEQYDARADLWSLGVILYEALFGRPPFSSKSFKELEAKIRSNKPVEIPAGARVSADCRDLLVRLLERDPEQRITFEEFFTHPFVDLDHMPTAESLEQAVWGFGPLYARVMIISLHLCAVCQFEQRHCYQHDLSGLLAHVSDRRRGGEAVATLMKVPSFTCDFKPRSRLPGQVDFKDLSALLEKRSNFVQAKSLLD